MERRDGVVLGRVVFYNAASGFGHIGVDEWDEGTFVGTDRYFFHRNEGRVPITALELESPALDTALYFGTRRTERIPKVDDCILFLPKENAAKLSAKVWCFEQEWHKVLSLLPEVRIVNGTTKQRWFRNVLRAGSVVGLGHVLPKNHRWQTRPGNGVVPRDSNDWDSDWEDCENPLLRFTRS